MFVKNYAIFQKNLDQFILFLYFKTYIDIVNATFGNTYGHRNYFYNYI